MPIRPFFAAPPLPLSLLLPICLLFALSLPAQAGEVLRLNSGVNEPYFKPDKQGFIDLLVPEVFRRIGIAAEGVQYAASERAMLNANNGVDDGVVLRIKGLEKSYPNLIRVDEKIIDNDFVAYTRQAATRVGQFADLRQLQVGYINGWKIFEANVPAAATVVKVQGAQQLFSLLALDRADVVLYERWQGNALLQAQGIQAHLQQPPLARVEMFMYLHRKHAHLVEPVAKALRAMKADGTWQRIAGTALPGFTPR